MDGDVPRTTVVRRLQVTQPLVRWAWLAVFGVVLVGLVSPLVSIASAEQASSGVRSAQGGYAGKACALRRAKKRKRFRPLPRPAKGRAKGNALRWEKGAGILKGWSPRARVAREPAMFGAPERQPFRHTIPREVIREAIKKAGYLDLLE